jgi:hypothetical protein
MAGMYMGPSSAFGGAFGQQGTANPTPPLPGGGGPIGPITRGPFTSGGGKQPPGKLPIGPIGPIKNPQGPFTDGGTGGTGNGGGRGGPITTFPPPAAGPNVLGAQAVRATGPSQGFDPAYLQNLATAIGGLFSGGKNGVMNVDPLGNLSEISGSSGQEGNAPQAGLPMTWLQQALNGLGFNFAPQATTPTAPTVGSIGGARSGGGGGGRGNRMAQ